LYLARKKQINYGQHRLTDYKIVLEKDASLYYGPIYPLSEEENKVLKEYIV